MLEGKCHCKNNIYIDKRTEHATCHKQYRVYTLHFQQYNITDADDKSLDHCKYNKQHPSAEICTGIGKIRYFCILIHFLFQN